MLNQLFQHKLLENHPEVEAVLDKIVSAFIVLLFLYTIPTFFKYSNNDLSWIIELTSFAIKIIILLILPILLFPERKEIWFLFGASFWNIPNGISDILFVDEYDNLFIFLKLLFLIAALYLTIKHIIKTR